MSKIVISGYYGFANAGDEAMLTAIVKSLRSIDSAVDLTVLSGNPAATSQKQKVYSVHRFNPFTVAVAISRCDLLLSGGGSLLQDITSKQSLLYYLSVLGLGMLLRKKVMLFAQGIGPINSALLRSLTRLICSRADLITVRDADSVAELVRIGVPEEKIILTADSVLTLTQRDLEVGRRLLGKFSVPSNKKLIGISVRNWQHNEVYFNRLAHAADVLAEKFNAHIVVLPLQYPADTGACNKLRSLMRSSNVSVLARAYDTEEFLSIIGNFSLLVGMRLHALIFAAVMEIPFIAVSYDPKIDGFVKEVGGSSVGDVASFSAEDIVNCAEKIMQRGNLQNNLKNLRSKAELNAKLAFKLLQKKENCS